MKLVMVYEKTPHIFKRFYMHGMVYSTFSTLTISILSATAFHTEYASKDRLTKEMGHEE